MRHASMAYCCEPLGCVILNEVKNQLPSTLLRMVILHFVQNDTGRWVHSFATFGV
jgi:hypothetical protein